LTNPNDTASVACLYAARGWAVIPIRAGAKVPIERDWPNRGRRTAPEVLAAWQLYPDANVGIVTGQVSGMWVLDIDPANGGTQALAGLVQAYGKLPETYVVHTPSGGLHYYFLLPEDFEPRNAQHGRRAGRLPVGIDVRGRGGQVVAPPSVRPDGTYTLVADFPLSPAPEWLLDMIRPLEPPERVEPVDAGGTSAAVLDDLNVGRFWDAWIKKVFTEELQRLASAPEGARDDVAIGVALRLVEICNSSWNDLELDDVFPHFMRAAQIASDGGVKPFVTGEEKWRNAIRRRAGVGVPPPAALGMTGTVWTPPILPPAPGASSDFDQAGQGPANPFVSPGGSGTSTHVAAQSINGSTEQDRSASGEVVAPDSFEYAVRVEMGRQLVRAEASRRLAENDQKRTDFDLELVTGSALDDLTAAVVLVDGYLDMDTLARVNGPSGHGKSFVTLDFACCVQTGRSWHGCAVTRAEAWYVVGEGARGMRRRERAWCERAGIESGESGVFFLPRALQVDGPEWAAFVEAARRRRPGLIVFDTQARMTVGVKENDATEMGMIVDALDKLRQASGACVLLVHHRGLAGEHGRGSTAIKGALDTEMDVSKRGTEITAKVTKRKDGLEPEPLVLQLAPYGPSAVLVGAHDTALGGGIFVSPSQILSQRQKAAIALAHALLDAPGLTKAEVRHNAKVTAGLTGTADAIRQTLYRGWSDLEDLGRIAKVQGREAYHFIDLDGASILSANPDKLVQDGPEVYEAP